MTSLGYPPDNTVTSLLVCLGDIEEFSLKDLIILQKSKIFLYKTFSKLKRYIINEKSERLKARLMFFT